MSKRKSKRSEKRNGKEDASMPDHIEESARMAARAAMARGFARGVRVVDVEGLVGSTEPPEDAELGLEMTPSERAYWLGVWRATLLEMLTGSSPRPAEPRPSRDR